MWDRPPVCPTNDCRRIRLASCSILRYSESIRGGLAMSRRFAVLVVGMSLVFGLSASAQEKKANVDAALDGLIKQAVDKGVDFLRKSTAAGAVASSTGLPIAPGGQALIGWTLLEC